MDLIFHEKQSGALCAQHCLNALLQESYFTVFDLADLAKALDESERLYMAEAGSDTREYQDFLNQPSSNYDDSGFFSIQVLQKALDVWNLSLVPLNSPSPLPSAARLDPTSQKAFICNFRQHWFAIRKIGNQWFNLNSLLSFPELLSDTYLGLFLKQIQVEGYSIFVVLGNLSECLADPILRVTPAVQVTKPRILQAQGTSENAAQGPSNADDEGNNDEQLQWALEESRSHVEEDDVALNNAILLSAADIPARERAARAEGTAEGAADRLGGQEVDESQVREKRLAFLERLKKDNNNNDANGQNIDGNKS